MATRNVKCLCENYDCKSECDYYKETIEPCREVVRINFYDDSEPFIRCLINNLNDFECDYFEEKKS